MSESGQLAALEKVVSFLEPYEREYPNITFGTAIRMENTALQREASAFVKPAWIARTIDIKLMRGGTVSVLAEILGNNLAVHPMWLPKQRAFSGSRYTVAHLPTTMIFASGLSLPRAKELAENVVHLDWNFKGVAMTLETREKAWVILQAFRLRQRVRKTRAANAK